MGEPTKLASRDARENIRREWVDRLGVMLDEAATEYRQAREGHDKCASDVLAQRRRVEIALERLALDCLGAVALTFTYAKPLTQRQLRDMARHARSAAPVPSVSEARSTSEESGGAAPVKERT